MRKLIPLLLAVTIILGACAKESSLPNPTGTGSIRAVNAIPGSPAFSFLIEERLVGTASYKAVTNTTDWDDLDYTFNFSVILTGDSNPTRVASQQLDVIRDTDYTFVIGGTINAPDITLLEAPRREFNDGDTVFEIRVANLSPSLGDVDIYLDDEAVPPALGSQLATLSLNESSDPIDLTAADLVLTVTPAGDDTTVLYQSNPIMFNAQTSLLIKLFDGDENDLAPVSVRTINIAGGGATAAIPDARFPPTLRFIQASLNFVATDIYLDDPLTTPVITDHAFPDIDGPVDVAAGTIPVTYVDSTNMGSLLIDDDIGVINGTASDLYVVRNSEGIDRLILDIPDRRSISTFARISVINTAASRDEVDIYIVPSGESIDEAFPIFNSLPVGLSPVQLPFDPQMLDLIVTDIDSKTPIAGPVLIDAQGGDVYEIILYENVDPNVVDVFFIP